MLFKEAHAKPKHRTEGGREREREREGERETETDTQRERFNEVQNQTHTISSIEQTATNVTSVELGFCAGLHRPVGQCLTHQTNLEGGPDQLTT